MDDTIDPMTLDMAREHLEQARHAYEAFQVALCDLGRDIRHIDHLTWERVDAYPGWRGTRDVGAGSDMTGWLDEIGEAIDAAQADRPCPDCGTRIGAHDPELH